MRGKRGLIAGDDGALLRSADGGAHWAAVSSGTDHRLVTADFPDPAVGYVLGQKRVPSGLGPYVDTHETVLLRTEDGGRTWKRRAVINEAAGQSIRFVDAKTGFMTLTTGIGIGMIVMKTRDGGSTWRRTAEFPAPVFGRIDFLDSLNLFGLGRSEVYRSRDGGETWSPEAIPAGQAHALYFPTPQAGFLACDWALLKIVPGAASPILAPRVRSAPILLGSDLRYRLDATMRVSALLFDVRGRQVSALFEGPAGPETHRLPWPAGIARGAYLLDFRAGGYRQVLPLRR